MSELGSIVRFIHDVFHDASRACKERRSVPPPRQALSKGKLLPAPVSGINKASSLMTALRARSGRPM
jgi:hypothetical protein